MRLVLEAVEAQELCPLAIYIAEDLQGWPTIASSGITVLYREAQAAGRHRPRLRRYGVAQRLFHRRQGRGQRCFVQLLGQGAIPGDADEATLPRR